MNQYKVVFLGTTEFSVEILAALAKHPQVELVFIITQPDRPQGRKRQLSKSPVKVWGESHNIKIHQPEALKTLLPLLEKIKPDLLITAAYGQIVPPEILATAQIEALNVHGSLLPAYRGGAPIQTAILRGEVQSGVSIIRMIPQLDAGPIFGQVRLEIPPDYTSGHLMQDAAQAGAQLLVKLLPQIAQGRIKPLSQDSTQISFAYNLKPSQEKIDWNQSTHQIHNQVRALAPHPGAFTYHDNQRLKIFQTRLTNSTPHLGVPGTIVHINRNSFEVETQDGVVEILEVQKAGRKRINAGLFAKNNLQVGERLNNDEKVH